MKGKRKTEKRRDEEMERGSEDNTHIEKTTGRDTPTQRAVDQRSTETRERKRKRETP